MSVDLDVARQRFELGLEAEEPRRKRQLEDQSFDYSDQWDPAIKAAREQDKRPCLTINRIAPAIKQITNAQRQNPPQIVVSPVDDGGDPETAEVLQGIIRNIENRSQADIAYETASESQARIGEGYFRVLTEYVPNGGGAMDIVIKRVLNRFSVVIDPYAQEFDKSDMEWAFVFTDFDFENFKSKYPNAQMSDRGQWDVLSGKSLPVWARDGSVRVCEYMWVEKTYGANPWDVSTTVRWAKITALDVLEEGELPGTRIPLIPIYGDERLDSNGDVDYRGAARDAKDPQRILNAEESAIVEQISLGARAPWLMVEGQDEGREQDWKTANSRNHHVLYFKRFLSDDNGTIHDVGVPVRNVAEPPIQAAAFAAQRAENHLRGVMGFIDVHGEEAKPEQSGRAILARDQQGQRGNLHYDGNLRRAVRSCGRLLLEWIPIVYSGPRIHRILGLDNKPKTVFAGAFEGQPPQAPDGVKGVFDLGVGRYDCVIGTGPSYASARQEGVTNMMELFKVAPAMVPMGVDVLLDESDWPGAKILAQRARKMLPPPLQEQPEGGLPPQAQAQIQQMQQALQALQQQNQQMQQELQTRSYSEQIKAQIASEQNQSRERIAALNGQIALMQTDAQLKAEGWQAQLAEQMENIRLMVTQVHDASQAQQARDHERQAQQESQAHQGAMSLQAQEAAERQAQQEPAGGDGDEA